MAEDDDFGDFSSAFSSNQTTGRGFETDTAVSTSSQKCGTNENYSTTCSGSAQPPEDMTFDAFASFPLENGGFADFHGFTPSSSFPPVLFEDGSVPEIPPLPDDLQINIKEVGVGDVMSTAEATSSHSTAEQPRSSEPAALMSTAMDANEFGDFESSFPTPGVTCGTSHSQTTSSSAVTTVDTSCHGSQMSECAVPGRNSEFPDLRSDMRSQHLSMDMPSHKSLSHSFETHPAFSSTSHLPEEGFADFNHFAQTVTSQPSKPDQGSAYTSQPPQSAVETKVQSTLSGNQIDDFGSFSSAEDEFRGFEGATTGQAPTTAANKESQETFVSSINQLASNDSSKFTISGNAFVLCFDSLDKSHVMDKQIVKLDPNNTSFDFRSWSTLRRSVDFTVPLYKWDTSHLQNCYYGSIKVDPMLVKKADSTSLMTMAPAVGQSAAADLMQSFGFAGGLEPFSSTDPYTSTLNEFQRNSDESGPALLDLSLPATPSVESQKDSFTLDADLLSLDLNSSQPDGKRTSIEELLLNEKLVVNRTTWMDSELMELGGAEPARTLSPPTSPPTSAKRKVTSLEQQLERLGLDTSKTTLASTSVTEMSISARLVYDRLPDLSFMISDTLVHNHAYRKC